MKLKIIDLLNIHKNEPCLILGSGKSLYEVDYEKFDGKIIAVGTTILRLKNLKKISYLVSANNHFPIPEIKMHLKFLNDLKNITWLMSDTAAYNDIWTKNDQYLKDNLTINWLNFDDRHENGNKCNPKQECCNLIGKEDVITLQEFFFKNFTGKKNFFKAITVAEFGIIFAMLFGCNPIYLAGIDLPAKNYYGHKSNKKYFGVESSFANNILNKTNKIIQKKYFYYYLKNFNFYPYIESAYFKLIHLLFNKSLFSFDLNKFEKNMEKILYVAKSKNFEIINLSNSSTINNIKGIRTEKPNIILK